MVRQAVSVTGLEERDPKIQMAFDLLRRLVNNWKLLQFDNNHRYTKYETTSRNKFPMSHFVRWTRYSRNDRYSPLEQAVDAAIHVDADVGEKQVLVSALELLGSLQIAAGLGQFVMGRTSRRDLYSILSSGYTQLNNKVSALIENEFHKLE